MLILTRKLNESIQIGTGPGAIRVKVTQVDRGKIRLGIEAPADVVILRSELLEVNHSGDGPPGLGEGER